MFVIIFDFKALAKILYFLKRHHTLKGQNFKLIFKNILYNMPIKKNYKKKTKNN